MSSKYGKQFDKALRLLREKLPLSVPVSVRTKEELKCDETGEDLFGQCMAHFNRRKRVTRFTIDIVRGLEVETAVDTLLHEWAHAVDQMENGDAKDEDAHRDSWGAAYAKAWRAFTDEG
jgi:hypothetical protein|tara:strand:- start:7349 stop:7705 length:357 start_codon:yes stop_codon:yes gene_type:complete